MSENDKLTLWMSKLHKIEHVKLAAAFSKHLVDTTSEMEFNEVNAYVDSLVAIWTSDLNDKGAYN